MLDQKKSNKFSDPDSITWSTKCCNFHINCKLPRPIHFHTVCLFVVIGASMHLKKINIVKEYCGNVIYTVYIKLKNLPFSYTLD